MPTTSFPQSICQCPPSRRHQAQSQPSSLLPPFSAGHRVLTSMPSRKMLLPRTRLQNLSRHHCADDRRQVGLSAGLNPGDVVVIDGQDKLQTGPRSILAPRPAQIARVAASAAPPPAKVLHKPGAPRKGRPEDLGDEARRGRSIFAAGRQPLS